MPTTVSPVGAVSELSLCAEMMATCALWRDHGYTYERCFQDLTHPDMRMSAIRDELGIAGFAAVLQPGMGFEPLVEYLCVREDIRSQGLGSLLLGWLEHGYERLYLTVTETNRARELYERRGWKVVGTLDDHETPGVAELIMRWWRTPGI